VAASVPFSSARKWSGVSFHGRGTWVLGAPDVLLGARPPSDGDGSLVAQVKAHADSGGRVLLLGRSQATLAGGSLPVDLDPMALVLLQDRVRGDAEATLRYFERQRVEVKVISGDDPSTVAAVAAEAGLASSAAAIDARTLPEDPERLADLLEGHQVFGRVTPQQKRLMIAALQGRGHVVAMTGDGVNDVLALKDADIGVAMGSGSAASRATARLVLLDSSFAALPSAVAEGRRVIANVERTGNLFLTKTVYAMLLALAVGLAGVPFPFLPRHLTLISMLTIGVPGFFLALAPSDRLARTGFIRRILRFAIPAGFLAAAATFTAYTLARGPLGASLVVARSTATIVLFATGVVILAAIASPLTALRMWLVSAMIGAFVAVLAIPPLRTFFALSIPPTIVWLGTIVLAVGATPLIWWLILKTREEQFEVRAAGVRSERPMRTTPSRPERVSGVGRPLRGVFSQAGARLPVLLAWTRDRFDPDIPRGLPLTVATGAAAAAIWVFGGLTQDVLSHDDTVLADPRLEALVVAHRVPWLTTTMRILTWLGSTAVLVPAIVVIGGIFLIRRQDWMPLWRLAVALGGAIVLSDIVKPAVGRPRPPAALWIGHYSGAAFPSGHAAHAIAFYTMLVLILSTGASNGWRALMWFGAGVVALVVGASRVYLGAHWVTDVLGGYALGAAWVAVLMVVGLLHQSRAPPAAEHESS
jgi:membrane-associated phospholipid phosphatase